MNYGSDYWCDFRMYSRPHCIRKWHGSASEVNQGPRETGYFLVWDQRSKDFQGKAKTSSVSLQIWLNPYRVCKLILILFFVNTRAVDAWAVTLSMYVKSYTIWLMPMDLFFFFIILYCSTNILHSISLCIKNVIALSL